MSTQRQPGKFIFTTKDLVIGYDEPLSSPLNISLERGSKVVLTGANGIGKTTLLKSLLGLISPLSGTSEKGFGLEIGYFAQEDGTDDDIPALRLYGKNFRLIHKRKCVRLLQNAVL